MRGLNISESQFNLTVEKIYYLSVSSLISEVNNFRRHSNNLQIPNCVILVKSPHRVLLTICEAA